ncbi:MAG: hypothetical protein ACYC9S_11840 [Leptospirales bacterium]
MFQMNEVMEMSEVMNRKDLFCKNCLDHLKRLSERQNTVKYQTRSLLLFMSGVYAFWIIGLFILVQGSLF